MLFCRDTSCVLLWFVSLSATSEQADKVTVVKLFGVVTDDQLCVVQLVEASVRVKLVHDYNL